MHALRKNLLARALVCTSLVIVAMAWAGLVWQEESEPQAPRPLPVLGYTLPPSAQDQALIAQSVKLLTAPAQGVGLLQGVDPALLAERTKSAEEPSVALVFMGNGRHYASIDGEMYTIGDHLPDGREVVGINRTGVGLDSMGQPSMLSWTKPKDTQLLKQKFAASKAVAPQNQTAAGPGAPGQAGPGGAGSLSTDQAMQLVKQLNEQQQAGKKP